MNTPLRAVLLGIGALALLAGVIVAIVWFRGSSTDATPKVADQSLAVLTASHPIAAGALLREGDMLWKIVVMTKPPTDSFVRGTNSTTELVGALTRHALSTGEIITSAALLRPGESGFLAATLSPGYRAVTIAVDAPQSASGLILPGDRVDVILVQNVTDKLPAHKSVGETVLYNARVVAVGRALVTPQKKPAAASTATTAAAAPDGALPATITLEVRPIDAQRLVVAGEIGKLGLALRPLGDVDEDDSPPPVWAGDVSTALNRLAPMRDVPSDGGQPRRQVPAQPGATGGPPAVLIIRGPGGGGQ